MRCFNRAWAIGPLGAASSTFTCVLGHVGLTRTRRRFQTIGFSSGGQLVGKGITTSTHSRRALHDRVPDHSLLIHDLFEGCTRAWRFAPTSRSSTIIPATTDIRRPASSLGAWRLATAAVARQHGTDAERCARANSLPRRTLENCGQPAQKPVADGARCSSGPGWIVLPGGPSFWTERPSSCCSSGIRAVGFRRSPTRARCSAARPLRSGARQSLSSLHHVLLHSAFLLAHHR